MLELDPIQIFFFIIGVGLVFTGVSMVFSKAFPEKRSSNLKEMALQLGFSFREKGDGSILKDFEALPFFRSGKNLVEENVMTKGMDDAFVAILDLTSATQEEDEPRGSDDEGGNPAQTVVCFKSNYLNLPPFFLRPKRHMGAPYAKFLTDTYTFHPIECFASQDFKEYFDLYGNDEEAIRKIFQNSGIVHLCEKEKDLCMEADGGHLIVYRFMKQMPSQEMEVFFEMAHQAHAIVEHGTLLL